jgi:hypothetical protein
MIIEPLTGPFSTLSAVFFMFNFITLFFSVDCVLFLQSGSLVSIALHLWISLLCSIALFWWMLFGYWELTSMTISPGSFLSFSHALRPNVLLFYVKCNFKSMNHNYILGRKSSVSKRWGRKKILQNPSKCILIRTML